MNCWICHEPGADYRWRRNDGYVPKSWYHTDCLVHMLRWMRWTCGLPILVPARLQELMKRK